MSTQKPVEPVKVKSVTSGDVDSNMSSKNSDLKSKVYESKVLSVRSKV